MAAGILKNDAYQMKIGYGGGGGGGGGVFAVTDNEYDLVF